MTLPTIQYFTDAIAERFSPDKIILFGSYAYGEPTEDSDVDILVLMPFEGSSIQKALEIRRIIGRPFAMDLLVRSPEDAYRRYKEGDPIIGDALDKGIVLYERRHTRVA